MTYEVRLSKRALRELLALQQPTRSRIVERLEQLKDDPLPRGVAKLQGRQDLYRVRVCDYRILYEVFRDEGLVLVEKVDHRGNVYGP
ncbi:MAG: type II toxin-antitoxin system RelE/ParE family toxin [Nitrososphaerota archaeon]|nr:type II toxin-antitoxin system RelE/ParE family toxin [Nitrososphaerota archaeon]MDG6977459.1 type II toxin-antitoxin system RelE/ParE family toxin [Nitrososphaerota archaeon]MDG6980957.1 type II toxin-antitoxin system RelE/ParE family toxin [Nitrososphaerota archaeon]